MFYPFKKPPQWLLDALYKEEVERVVNLCPDCGVSPKQAHADACDVAHCLNTKIQRLQCDCGECGEDIWTGLWPGVQRAYEKGWICFDTASEGIMFDLNRVVVFEQTGKDTYYHDLVWGKRKS
jgi:hypothetical protein